VNDYGENRSQALLTVNAAQPKIVEEYFESKTGYRFENRGFQESDTILHAQSVRLGT
jgi:hypothetical protein